MLVISATAAQHDGVGMHALPRDSDPYRNHFGHVFIFHGRVKSSHDYITVHREDVGIMHSTREWETWVACYGQCCP